MKDRFKVSMYKYTHSNMLLDTEMQGPSIFPRDEGVHGNSTEITLRESLLEPSAFFHLFF